jgi:prepilin-type N-terminal cleavage/methylation domain-containing protein
MRSNQRRSGFTLIEVLIVVVIMAVLAATILPQFSSATKDAKDSSIKFNLHAMRSQIELYKINHLGVPPTGALDLQQLVQATDVNGVVSTTGQPDTTHPYGPYIQNGKVPANPYNGTTTVTVITSGTGTPTATGAGAWIYRSTTGEIYADNTDLVSQ